MMNEDWEVVKSLFPKNWRWLAKRTKVLKGLRKDKDPEKLLRSLMLHFGCGYSLRETSVRIRQSGIADLSDVALLKRLKKSKDWLHSLCLSLFRESGAIKKNKSCFEFRLVDSTIIKEQGATGSLWRIHYSVNIPSLKCDFFKLTPAKGSGNGDALSQYPVNKGDYIIADRGFCQSRGIAYVDSKKAYACIRVNPAGIKLKNIDGSKFELLSKLKTIPTTGMIGEWEVSIPGETNVVGRICALRKSEEAVRKAQKKLKLKANRNGVKLKPETLEFAKYIILFTTFPADEFSAEMVLEGYRFRWQIELIFKRFKQIAQLGHLPKQDQESAEAWLYGKLFMALITQKIIEYADSFSPWGYDLGKITTSAKSLA